MVKNNIPFNVLRNPNDWENAPRDPISMAIANAVTGLAVTATTLGAASVAWWAVAAVSTVAVTAVIGYASMKLFGPEIPDFDSPSLSGGTLVNSNGAIQSQEFVYGRVRKGGARTFIDVSGTDNKILHMIICLAGHEIDGVDTYYVNDQAVSVNSSGVVTDTDWNSKIKIYFHDGSQTSATDNFANVSTNLQDTLHNETNVGSDFIGKGIAYLYVRLEYDAETFTDGVPLFTAIVRGKKVVKTISGVEQTAVFSDNAAWCIRDFLTSDYGLNADDIDYATFEAAASTCDESVTISAANGGGSESRYTINGVIRSDEQIANVLTNMTKSCAGTLYYGTGSWRLHVGEHVTPTKTLTLDDFRSGISMDTKTSMRDNFNTVKGVFLDKDNDYIQTDYPQYTSTVFQADDNNVVVETELNFPFTTSSAAAQRIAKQTLLRSRLQINMYAEFSLAALDIEVGDFINVSTQTDTGSDRYGWGSGKEFQVMSWKLVIGDGGDIRVGLTLRESDADAFEWSVANEQAISTLSPTLLKFNEVPNLAITTSQIDPRIINEDVTNGISVVTSTPESERIDYVEVRYKKSSDSTYINAGYGELGNFEILDIDTPLATDNPAYINYDIEVTAVNTFGFKKVMPVVTQRVDADTDAPAAPTNFSKIVSGGALFLQWDAVAAADLSHYKIYHNSSTTATFTSTGRTLVIPKVGRPATTVSYASISGTFFVTGVDKSGNEGPSSSVVVLSSELPALNTTVEHTENPNFNGIGSQTDLTVTGGELRLSASTPASRTAVYYFDHNGTGYIDSGTVRNLTVSHTLDYDRAVTTSMLWDDIPNNWDTWPSNWDDWTSGTLNFGDATVTVELRATSDNPASSPTWGSWQTAVGQINARAVQFRATLTATTASVTPSVSVLKGKVQY